jgi:outer membrane protein, multidrug efflux system
MGARMRLLPLIASSALAGCSMAPAYVRPGAPVPASWPVGDAYLRQSEASLPQIDTATIFPDPRLQRLFAIAAANSRDLRIAAANVAAARASYQIQRADQLPVIGAGAGVTRSDGSSGSSGSSGSGTRFSASIGITSFEIDLFGRVASLTRAEQERFFATEPMPRCCGSRKIRCGSPNAA